MFSFYSNSPILQCTLLHKEWLVQEMDRFQHQIKAVINFRQPTIARCLITLAGITISANPNSNLLQLLLPVNRQVNKDTIHSNPILFRRAMLGEHSELVLSETIISNIIMVNGKAVTNNNSGMAGIIAVVLKK